MAEPRIQYARTSDEVNIAYYVLGEGEPATIYMTLPTSHLQAEWKVAPLRAAFEAAARRRKFVRLDPRGFGLSDRDVALFSVDAMVADISAVVDRAGLERVGLYAQGFATVPAIAYAARHPEKVTHLILPDPAASAQDLMVDRLVALRSLVAVDWVLASETVIRSFFPESPDPFVKAFAELFRESVDAEPFLHFWDQCQLWNADDDARALRATALLIHIRSDPNASMATTRRVAALIPDCHIAFADSRFEAPRAANEFFFPEEMTGRASPEVPGGMAVILFTDIVDSTALTERLGDAAFREKARDLDSSLRTVIREAGGTPIEGKLLGDGVLATFASARQAIEAALACGTAGNDAGLPLHLGLHAGDVIREENNVFGGAVNVASRISGLSAPGEVLVSQTVRDLARTSAGVAFEDRGERSLKGVGDPVRVWAVVGTDASTSSARTEN